jgi:outer membrane lipoprotein-sorting protein
MNDLPYSCERWAELISLLPAGCLSSEEERDVRRHIDTCPSCRERFQQVQLVCGALADVPPLADEEAAVARIVLAVKSGQTQPPIVPGNAGTGRATVLSRSLNTWRWIMRSPVSRVAAAVVFVVAVAGVAFWFHGVGIMPAFADFLEPILTAKTVTFKTTCEEKGHKTTGKVMAIASQQRMRLEQDMPNKSKIVTVFDDKGNSLKLFPDQKLAIVTAYTNMPKEERPKLIFFELQSQLADARDRPDWIREPLGEKEIDGRRLVGYRLTGHGMISDLWGDPKNGMPVRIENRAPSTPKATMIESDFVFNTDLDESLFSMEPPAGYKVQKQTMDVSPAQERDLIETLRHSARLRGGALPDQFDLDALARLFQEDWAKTHPMKGGYPSEKEIQEQLNGLLKITRGISFAFEQLPPEADAHYAGKGVKFGAADKPIFWYRPKDSKKYRVIYADLTLREADTPPSVLNAQPVPGTSKAKKK